MFFARKITISETSFWEPETTTERVTTTTPKPETTTDPITTTTVTPENTTEPVTPSTLTSITSTEPTLSSNASSVNTTEEAPTTRVTTEGLLRSREVQPTTLKTLKEFFCADNQPDCSWLAAKGHCVAEEHARFMQLNCRKTCQQCGVGPIPLSCFTSHFFHCAFHARLLEGVSWMSRREALVRDRERKKLVATVLSWWKLGPRHASRL